MAGIYTRYTLTSQNKLFIIYKCSKCCQINVQLHTITEKSIYDDRGAYTKKKIEDRKAEAQQILNDRKHSSIDKFLDGINTHKYTDAKLNCKCTHCQYVELWSKMRYPINKIIETMALLMIIPILFLFLMEYFVPAIIVFIVATAVFCISNGYKYLNNLKLEKKIAEIDPVFLPTVATNATEAQEAITALTGECKNNKTN